MIFLNFPVQLAMYFLWLHAQHSENWGFLFDWILVLWGFFCICFMQGIGLYFNSTCYWPRTEGIFFLPALGSWEKHGKSATGEHFALQIILLALVRGKGSQSDPDCKEAFFPDDDKNLCAHLFFPFLKFCLQIGNDALFCITVLTNTR